MSRILAQEMREFSECPGSFYGTFKAYNNHIEATAKSAAPHAERYVNLAE
jgi:hypothetical protein